MQTARMALASEFRYRSDYRAEIEQRLAEHQERIKSAGDLFLEKDPPLILLADGDSWFDYPLDGTYFRYTDIVAQLPSIARKPPFIANFAHFGDSSTTELGLARREKLISAMTDKANGTFDAVLFSGGGDDIVGDQFCIWLTDAASVAYDTDRAINKQGLDAMIEVIIASIINLIDLVNKYLPRDPAVPLFVHGYDFAYPSGVGVWCIGPWLRPSLAYRGWMDPPAPSSAGREIVTKVLKEFGSKLTDLATQYPQLVYVQTQGTLQSQSQWANELHPTRDGFGLLARVFLDALRHRFGDRI